jgi:hypothetical protein
MLSFIAGYSYFADKFRNNLASSAGIAFRLSGKISCRQKNLTDFLKYVNYEMPAEEARNN